jgi:threonine/homoserine/homoserine lactone efflux protein
MKSSLPKAALWGGFISLMGTLPLGTLNILAMQVSVSEGIRKGIFFSLGVALVEIFYVRLSVVGLGWIMKHARLMRYLEWAAVFIVAALAFGSFRAAFHPSVEKNIILTSQLPKFLLGMSLSAINPMQIPFWFGWTTVMFSKEILYHRSDFYNAYVLGIGVGTMLGLMVFVVGGAFLVNRLNASQQLMNLIIGSIFALTAVILMIKIFIRKPLDQTIAEKAAALEHAEHEHP